MSVASVIHAIRSGESLRFDIGFALFLLAMLWGYARHLVRRERPSPAVIPYLGIRVPPP